MRAILGGTFDPPHIAHLAAGEAAYEQLGVDTVTFLPAGRPWQKAGAGVSAAALGDMLELGETSERAHRDAGAFAAELGIDWLFLFGAEVRALRDGAVAAGMPPSRAIVFEDKTTLVGTIRKELNDSAVLLVKGSREMRMEEVVELLTAEAPAS